MQIDQVLKRAIVQEKLLSLSKGAERIRKGKGYIVLSMKTKSFQITRLHIDREEAHKYKAQCGHGDIRKP